jgi:hypothetical protein
MSEANVEIVASIYELMARRDDVTHLVADDFEYVNPPYAVEGGVRVGRDSLNGVFEIYSDFRFEVERYLETGDDVVAIGIASGSSPSGLFRWFIDPAEALAAAGLDDD